MRNGSAKINVDFDEGICAGLTCVWLRNKLNSPTSAENSEPDLGLYQGTHNQFKRDLVKYFKAFKYTRSV